MSELFPSTPYVKRGLGRAARFVGRVLRRAGRAMLYILPVLILIHLIAVVVTGRQLQGDIDRLTKAGILLPAKDLIPTIPAGAENAADVYQSAWKRLRLSTLDESTLFDRGVNRNARWFAVARRIVTANPEYYRLLDRATSIEHCVFPVEWEGTPGTQLFPHFAEMRKAARMLSLRAAVDVADGQTDAAVRSVDGMCRVAQHAQVDPILIGSLVSYTIQGIGVKALQGTLDAGAPSPDACRSLYQQLATIDNVASSVHTVKGEMGLFGLGVFNSVRSGQTSIADLTSGNPDLERRHRLTARIPAWLRNPVFNADERVYLSYMEKEIPAFGLPWPESRNASDAAGKLEIQAPIYAILTRMVFPIYSRMIWSRDRTTAGVGAAQIALALKAYQAERGAYPASLSELEAAGWKLPVDPFVQKPYHYRREKQGFVVWSTGPDMDDDNASKDYESFVKRGGRAGPEEKEDYDIVFRVAR